MRAVGLVVVALTACSSAPPEDADPLRPARDTGADTAHDTPRDAEPDTASDTSAPEDAADTAITEAAPDTAEDAIADTAPTDTAGDAAVDTGPALTETWSTTFPVKQPAGFDTAPAWFVQRARLGWNDVAVGGRALPVGPTWRAWTATLKIDRHEITCPEVEVLVSVQWNCVASYCDGSDVTVKIPRSTSTPTWTGTASGVVDTPFASGTPSVRISIANVGVGGGPCGGRIDVWPSPITFAGTP